MGPRGQEPNESTDDAVWNDLVARLEGTSTAPQDAPDENPSGRHYGAHLEPDTDHPDAERAVGHEGQTDRERAEAIFRNQPLVPGGPRDYSPTDQPDENEGFTPAEPPPLGTGDPLTVLAWIGAAGGPIMLLLFAMFWRNAPLAAWLGLLLVFLAGAGYLVTKLPKHRDFGDDGAEV